MLLHLGEETVVRHRDIIGIFDLDTATVSGDTRQFLADAEKGGRVVNVSYELPRSFTVTATAAGETVYISQLATATLAKRIKNILKNAEEP